MTQLIDAYGARPSRRRLLTAAAGIAGAGLALAATPALAAGSKMSPASVSYRDKPQGSARCDGCNQWQAPAACKVVSGAISPSGWCSIYAPAAKS